MAKRPAEESLEDATAMNSPALKKTKRHSQALTQVDTPIEINGHTYDRDEKDREDSTAVSAHKGQESEEDGPLGNDEGEMEQSADASTLRQDEPLEGYTDLYLDTIDRSLLDFDFEKLCSITLSNINVYACLVCGRYYQGRGPKSHAYFHALEVGHHVFVNMQSKRVYVLPEGYEVKSKSLNDIKFVVDPRLSKQEVAQLDTEEKDAWDLAGKKYRPGE